MTSESPRVTCLEELGKADPSSGQVQQEMEARSTDGQPREDVGGVTVRAVGLSDPLSADASNRDVQVGGATMTRDQALQLFKAMMNTESHTVENTWFDTNEHHDDVDDPVEKDLCAPTLGLKIGITSRYLLVINIGGNVVKWDVLKVVLRVVLLALVLVSLWLALGKYAQPGGAVFAIVTTILFGAVIGMAIAKITGFPPLIGFLLAGIIWGSMGMAAGLPYLFYSCVRTAALTAILCRAGINFKWSIIKPVALNVALIGMIPQVTEGIAHACMAKLMFPQHTMWLTALIQGAVVAPASSAIIITVIYPLRAAGYSVARGPGLLMYVACAADSVFAVWLVNFLLGILFPTPGADFPLWQRVLLAPLQILLGAILGVISGKLIVLYSGMYFARNKNLSGPFLELAEQASKRDTALFILFSQGALILLANYVNLPGTGTVAAAVAAATISHTWYSSGLEERKNELNKTLADIWDSVIAPMLFSLVGASIDISMVSSVDFLRPALACIVVGLLCKSVVLVVLQTGTGVLFKEKIFFAVGFWAKSTVQAAMSGKFLDYATNKWQNIAADSAQSAAQEIALGKLVQQTGICALAICAIIGGVSMKMTAPCLLIKDEDYYAKHPEEAEPTAQH